MDSKLTRRELLAGFGAAGLARRAGGQILAPILMGGNSIPLNGLIGRYESPGVAGAQGAAIATWSDLSGLGNHATQSTGAAKPLVNTHTVSGVRALQFNGIANSADCWMNIPAALSFSSQSLSAVLIMEPFAVSGTSDQYVLSFDQTNNYAYARYNPQLKGGPALGSSNPAMYIPFGPQMFGFASSASGWKYILRNTFSNSAGTVAAHSSTGGAINAFGAGSFAASANFYAVFIYSRALTQADINKIWAYAQAKYRCQPVSTSYLIACCGDSQTSGYVASGFSGLGWVQQYQVANPGYTVFNFGLTGSKTSALNSPDAVYSATPAKRICTVWSGTNDDATGTAGTWVSTSLTNIQNFVSARRATGWKVVTATMLPRSGAGSGVTNASYETDRQTFNSSLRANSGGIYGDAIADVGNDSSIGQSGDENNATYFSSSDHTHLTQAGYAIVEGYFATAISSL